MTRTFKTLIAATLCTTALLSAASIQPASAAYGPRKVILGGVNLDAYCKRHHGQNSHAVVVADTAGGWRCNNYADAVYGISVQQACQETYKQRPIKAIVVGADKPGSWRCQWQRK